MQELNLIIERLDIIDADLKKIINQEIKIPYLDDYNSVSDYLYPHPPCLIPLFLGYGASYKGVIHHFFCERKDTFAEYFLEQGFLTEIARNSKQWLTLIVLDIIMVKDGLNDEIINFCKQIHYNDYEEADQFTVDFGDDPNEFNNLIYLKENLPSKYIKQVSEYNGDFPSTLSALNLNELKSASIFEIAVPEQLSQLDNVPLWLNPEIDKPTLFNDYISKNMLKEAWFTLNSKGWKMQDAVNAMEELAMKTDDELFHLITKNWINSWKKSNNQDAAY